MLEFSKDVFLPHELRKLVCSKKFLDAGLERSRRNKLNGKRCVSIDSRHPVLDISLDLTHTDADFLLQKLSDESHATRSKMINIILHRLIIMIKIDDMVDDRHKVLK